MKKALLFALLLLISLPDCFAQDSHTRGIFSIGIDGSFIGKDYDRYLMTGLFKNGIGGSLKIEVPVHPNFYITATSGLSVFEATDQTKASIDHITASQYTTSESFGVLKVGVKCYTFKGLFMEIQAGGVFNSGKTVEFMTKGGVSAAYSAGIGYLFHNGIELGARYELWKLDGSVDQMNFVAIRLAYAIKFPRR